MTKNKLVQITENSTQQNMYGAGVQIANAGHIDLFIINNATHVRLDAFRFDTSHYNLFVINDQIESFGDFIIPYDLCLKHSDSFMKNRKINKALLEQVIRFPSLIAIKNEDHLYANENCTAKICKVHGYYILDEGIKFKYIVSKEIKQQYLNDCPSLLGIMSSNQSNELDEVHWEIKNFNLINALSLESEYEQKK